MEARLEFKFDIDGDTKWEGEIKAENHEKNVIEAMIIAGLDKCHSIVKDTIREEISKI